MVVVAAVLNLGNDLSYKPKLSFIKVSSLLMILGVVSYTNNPIIVFGCILTFFYSIWNNIYILSSVWSSCLFAIFGDLFYDVGNSSAF